MLNIPDEIRLVIESPQAVAALIPQFNQPVSIGERVWKENREVNSYQGIPMRSRLVQAGLFRFNTIRFGSPKRSPATRRNILYAMDKDGFAMRLRSRCMGFDDAELRLGGGCARHRAASSSQNISLRHLPQRRHVEVAVRRVVLRATLG
jgi:hypothetical protein